MAVDTILAAVGILVSVADNHGGLYPIFARMINCCWFCFKWGLVSLVIGVLGGLLYLDHRVDEEIRCHVERLIAQHYTGLEVSVRSATLVKGEGIRIRVLSILDRGAEGPRAELAILDEVMLVCKTDLHELIVAKPRISQITITGLTLPITLRPDGTFSAAKLLPLPKFSDRPPKVVIENGTIEIFDPLKNPSSTYTFRNLNLTIFPPDPTSQTPLVRKIQGTLTADHLSHVEIEGWIDSQTQRWTIRGTVDGLDVSPEMREALPGPMSARLAMLGNLRGHVDLDFRVAYDPSAPTPLAFQVKGALSRGRTDDPRLPHPLTDMRANFVVTNEGFGITQLVASMGQAMLRVYDMHGTGFDLNSRLELRAGIQRLELDPQLRRVLPSKLQEQWDKFRPAGEINAEVALLYDGATKTWQSDIAVECLDVSFTHDQYPYRLDHGTGSVTLKNDLLEVHLDAYSGTQLVDVDAKIHHPLTGPVGWFEVNAKGLQIDVKMLGALQYKPRSQAFIRSLHPTGTIDLFARLERHEPNGPVQKTVDITLNGCSVRYEKFPYPIYNVCGMLAMRDDHWTFFDLVGNNDTGRITCNGTMLRPQEGQRLHLTFTGRDMAMEHELRDAIFLKPNVQRVWDALRPRGTIDWVVAEVDYLPETKKLSVGLRAELLSETASIEPIPFPYRMEKLSTVLIYGDGHVTIERFKAKHGQTTMSAVGGCDFLPSGNWELRLKEISVDQLQLDDELILALPKRLKRAIVELNPRGPGNRREGFRLNIHRGSFDLFGGVNPGEPVQSRWNLAIGLNQGSIDCGIKLEKLHGEITMAGAFNGQTFYSQGELNLDSLTFRDFQLTRLMGPIWIDDGRVLLGAWADRRRKELTASSPPRPQSPTRRLTAKLLGGTFYGDGWLTLGEQPRYQLNASLTDAELKRYAQEMMMGRQELEGKISASIDLHGTGRSINGLVGRGELHLRDADIYELPVMISMLKILSIREPDRTAFSKCDTEFVIQGPHIYFQPINFNGDAISLRGQGQMDLQSNIDLVFHAVVGRDEIHVPVISELLGGASEQIMQFQVSGTLLNPVTKKVALPALNQMLQQLQNERRSRINDSRFLFPQARQLLLNQRGPNRR